MISVGRSIERRASRDISRAAGACVILLGLILGITARADLGLLGLAALGSACVLMYRPAMFLGLAMALYGSIQFALEESLIFSIAGVQINASRIFILALSAAMGFRLLASFVMERNRPPLPRSVVASAAFSVWMLLSLIHTIYRSEGSASFARIVSCTVALAFAAVFVRTWRDFTWVWIGSAVTTLVACGFAFLEFARGSSLAAISVGSHRAEGSFGGAVVTGTVAFFGLALSVGVLLARERFRKHRLLAILTAAFALLGMVATFTRTAILGTVLLAGLIVLMSSSSRVRAWSFSARLALVVLIGLALVGGMTLVGEDAIESRLADVPGIGAGGGISTDAGSGRGLIWSTALARIAANSPRQWLLGHGLMSVPNDMQRIIGLYVGAHNSYIAVLYDAGLPALGLYLFFVFAMLSDLLRGSRTARDPELASIVGIWHLYYVAFFLSTVMFNGYVYTIGARWYSMIVAGALLGLVAHQQREGQRLAGN